MFNELNLGQTHLNNENPISTAQFFLAREKTQKAHNHVWRYVSFIPPHILCIDLFTRKTAAQTQLIRLIITLILL
jgi:hypothetical protein